MLGASQWKSWDAFEASVAPKHVTKSTFDRTRDQPPLQVQVTVAYGYGCIFGMLTSAASAVEAWAAAET